MNYLLAIIFPPIGVLASRAGGSTVFVNLILTLMFYLPGLLHALYVVHSRA